MHKQNTNFCIELLSLPALSYMTDNVQTVNVQRAEALAEELE